jgi:hypothetical protein
LHDSSAEAGEKIPIIYSTDLFQPHDDPDDHYDLATLFALKEFDILGIIVEHGSKQADRPGRIPVDQMMHLAGRQVRCVVGLNPPMIGPDDKALGQPEECQQGVKLILDELRKSRQKVTIFTTGSMRDVAVALNRDPELMHRKVKRLYMNIGNSSGEKSEYNVGLEIQAYRRILESGLPIYWCPCFGHPYGTFWKFRQGDVLKTAPAELQNFFLYALTTGRQWKATPKPATNDPIGFLSGDVDAAARREVWKRERNMWCTAPFLHAAGRQVILAAPRRWVAEPAGKDHRNAVGLFEFVPGRITIGERGLTTFRETRQLDDQNPVRAFKVLDPDRYGEAMTSCLRELFSAAEHSPPP